MERGTDPARFQELVDFVPGPALVVGAEGLVVGANARASELFGYSSEELAGRPLEVLTTDSRGRRKDGSEFAARISRAPVESADGPVSVVAVHELGDQRRARGRFEQIVDQAPDAIVVIDERGVIVFANARAESMFGYPREDLIGSRLETLVPRRRAGAHPLHWEDCFQDPGRRPVAAVAELLGRRRDGTDFPCEISLARIDAEDGPQAIAAIRDMTERSEAERRRQSLDAELDEAQRRRAERERRDLEEQLNQLRRLESVGQLAGGIAHDFNNILGVILNYSQFVAEELGEDCQAYADVMEIQRAAERAAALTRQLLIFSRREVVRPRLVDLAQLVAELDRLLRRALGEHLELETLSREELWPVLADPGQIEQVLVNLAINARDAMPGGGQLRIETSNVDIDASYAEVEDGIPPGRYVRLQVSDTGSGMSAEVAARAFEPFFTTKPKGEGTGLGLTTVYGIVTDAGGYVRVASEVGVGTTVRVHLPAAEGEIPEHRHVASQRPPARGERILVVEDEEGVREVTRRILEEAGYAVTTAVDGPQAVELLQSELEIDLLLTDVVMPEMLGSEVADLARWLRPELAVLFMSGYIQQMLGTLEPGRADTVDFIEKPFTAETLLVGVRNILDRRPEEPADP